MSTAPPPGGGPLAGLRVVELAGLGPAQHGCMLLADLGADVVKVDRKGTAPGAPDPRLELLSRGRRSIALDLKDPVDHATLWRLVDRADVLVDPYRPGVCERLGLAPEAVLARNPRVIVARMTGWGQDGPLATAAGHDLNYIALAGALGQIGPDGGPPTVPLNLVGDFGGGGMLLAFGILAAVHERERSGRGQVLDVAMVDGVASLMASVLQLRAMGLWEEGRGRNWLQGAAPWYRAYETADARWITVGPLEAKFFAQLLVAVGLDPGDWPQWDRAAWPALSAALAERFAARTLAEWTARLEGTDVCFAPVLELDELTEHPHLRARETFLTSEGHLQPAPVPRFSRTPGAVAGPPPRPGEHDREVREELDPG